MEKNLFIPPSLEINLFKWAGLKSESEQDWLGRVQAVESHSGARENIIEGPSPLPQFCMS